MRLSEIISRSFERVWAHSLVYDMILKMSRDDAMECRIKIPLQTLPHVTQLIIGTTG